MPFFIKSEDNVQVNEMDYGFHGVGGPLTVTRFPYHPPLSYALLDAGRELGIIICSYYKINKCKISNLVTLEVCGGGQIDPSATSNI